MRVIVIGATGTIGKAVVEALADRHEIVRAGRHSGDHPVDIASGDSIERFFEAAGPFDALVSAAGDARFGELDALTDEDFAFSLTNKLMGQVNLVRAGLRHARDQGSFTLTSGLLARYPVKGSAALTLVNAGLEGFARVAALEAPRGIRVNVVSPTWVRETLEAMGRDGSGGLPAATVARAYVESIEGTRTGEILDVREFRDKRPPV